MKALTLTPGAFFLISATTIHLTKSNIDKSND